MIAPQGRYFINRRCQSTAGKHLNAPEKCRPCGTFVQQLLEKRRRNLLLLTDDGKTALVKSRAT